jgi:hypothetical protein
MAVRPSLVEGRTVQILSVDWDVIDDRGLSAYTSSLRPPGPNQYSINTWGQPFFGNGTARTEYVITEFFPSGVYQTAQVIMKDYGLNQIYAYFTDGGGAVDGTGVKIDEPPPRLTITTPNPDYDPPELDLNRISVVAAPTVPEAPNGETQVTIQYLARDNKAGVGPVNFRLRDPQGSEHFFYHYHDNFWGTFFRGDPTAWKQYTATVLLPMGSVPGTWGLASLELGDKALNRKSYSFVELVRFDPFSTAAADLGITGDPVGGSYAAGGELELRVITVGGNRVSYRWLKDGVALTEPAGTAAELPPRAALLRVQGANTPILRISGLTGTDAGSYAVVVSNAAGSVFSRSAQVLVTSSQPPEITAQPQSVALAATGGSVTFTVAATGSPAPTFQWYRNGTLLPGATAATLTVDSGQVGAVGRYTVVVANAAGQVTSTAASLEVSQPGTQATQAATTPGYVAGQDLTVTNSLFYTGTATALSWAVVLPPEWSFVGASGALADVGPRAGDRTLLEWAWSTVPPSPVTFTYTVRVPAGQSGPQDLVALVGVRNGAALQFLARPDPLRLEPVQPHSADTDRNFRISLLELTRVIELYNTRNGATRTGSYALALAATEDGFASDLIRAASVVASLARYHSGDTNRDGRIGLLELTRVIELYNTRSGGSRTGQYKVRAGTEDGFDPGP